MRFVMAAWPPVAFYAIASAALYLPRSVAIHESALTTLLIIAS